MNTFSIVLDLDKSIPRKPPTVRLRQGDSDGTTISAQIFDHGTALSATVSACDFAMRLPDGTHYYRKSATYSGGVATVLVDETQAASVTGNTALAYFQLTVGTAIYSTGAFTVFVEPDAVDGAELPESYDDSIQTFVNAWLDEHPDATTTVQDGAITTAKLADGSVTDAKLALTGGVLSDVSALCDLSMSLAGEGRWVTTTLNGIMPTGTVSISGRQFTHDGWRPGYYAANGNSYNSLNYIRSYYRLDKLLGSLPSAIAVEILDTTELEFPYITVGYTNSGTSLAQVYGKRAVAFVPTYPDLPDPTKGLVVCIGKFTLSDAESSYSTCTREAVEARIMDWTEQNVRVTAFYRVDPPRIGTRSSENASGYIYDSTLEYALMLPSTYSALGSSTPLVIMPVGLGSRVLDDGSWPNADGLACVQAFVAEGYAVMSCNRVTTQDWCNPALYDKYRAAISDITSKYNVSVDFVYGLSMGGLIGMHLAMMYPSVKAIAISALRLDMEARYENLDAADKAIVDANVGFTNGYDEQIMAQWCETTTFLVDSDNEGVNTRQLPPSLYLWTDGDDYITESLAKIDEVRRGGNVTKVSGYTGTHHQMCYLMNGTSRQDVIDWFDHWS